MKKSQFIVEQVGFSDDTILLYSTYTTSLVELDKKIYEEVFINKNYTKNKEDVQALYDMGFLVSDDKDEVAFLEKLRIETLKANSSSPSYGMSNNWL